MSSTRLNDMLGIKLFFKCENFQKAGVFKSRGACNALFSLTRKQLLHGVAAHSSGNHAQALARAALLRNTKAYIVMPEDSSRIKIEAVNSYGGIITFCEPTLEARENTLRKVMDKYNTIEIHPYDNYSIIAGQATLTLEMIKQVKNLDCIVCPVGGGGLLSGQLLAAHYFSPLTKVFAAEPEQANDAFCSFKSGCLVPSINPLTIADGLRTSLGELTYPIIMKYLSDIYTVSESEIIYSMKLIWETMKIIVEPSAAVGLAVVIKHQQSFRGKRCGIIISGGNVDLNALPWKQEF